MRTSARLTPVTKNDHPNDSTVRRRKRGIALRKTIERYRASGRALLNDVVVPLSSGVRSATSAATTAAVSTVRTATTTVRGAVPPEVSSRAGAIAASVGRAARVTGVTSKDKDDAALRKRVWGLAIPSIGEQLLALGVGLSDTFLSGHLSDSAIAQVGYGRAIAVDAVGTAGTVGWVVLTVFFAINVGVTALVARATGAKDPKLASRAAGQGIILSTLIGLATILLTIPLATALINLLGVTGQVADLATQYARIFSFGLPMAGAASAITAAMRGAGDVKRPLLVMLLVNGVNVIGSWTLMNGVPALGIPAIGVIGSAIGAACGWLLGCVMAFVLITRKHPHAPHLTWESLRPSREISLRVLKVGVPSAAELGIFQIGVLTFARSVIGLGPDVYAANTTINTVESMGTLPGLGFSVAATALVGQALGAKDPDLAERSVWASLRPCIAVMTGIGMLAALFPQVMLGMFVADPHVLEAGDLSMRLSLLTLPGSGFVFIVNGSLRGAGDTRFPVLIRVFGTWVMRVPLATFLLIPLLGLPGARLSMAVDWVVQSSLAYWRFRGGHWRKTRV